MSRYWTWQDRYFLNLGTIQLMKLNMTAPGAHWSDEPIELGAAVIAWLTEHESREYEDICGVPTFEFPNKETMLQFAEHFSVVPKIY